MKINGNIEVLGYASIKLPTILNYDFSPSDKGKLYLDEEGNLKINTGEEVLSILDENSPSIDLVNVLGNEWVNPDGTFNPTELNKKLSKVLSEPLDGNDSLYNVILQLSNAISQSTQNVKRFQDVYSGSSAYHVQHNLNQLYCYVTVIEGTNMVKPSEYTIMFDTPNTFIITFNTPRNVTVLVMG